MTDGPTTQEQCRVRSEQAINAIMLLCIINAIMITLIAKITTIKPFSVRAALWTFQSARIFTISGELRHFDG